MRMLAALAFVLAAIIGLGALTPPAAAVAGSADIPASIDDTKVAAGGCCDCGAICETTAGAGNCPVHCEAASVLSLAAFIGSAAPRACLDRARPDDRDGRCTPPDPAPPKHSFLNRQSAAA